MKSWLNQDTEIILPNGFCFLLITFHNNNSVLNSMYLYYQYTSNIYAIKGSNNYITWTLNENNIKFSSSEGTPYLTYIRIAS